MVRSLIPFFFMILCHWGHSQTSWKEELLEIIKPVQRSVPQWDVARNNKNLGQKIFSGIFLFYKRTISSQDHNHCSFEPSCSEYAILSLKKHGILIAIVDAADRLLRCNGMSPENYEYNPETELLVDLPF